MFQALVGRWLDSCSVWGTGVAITLLVCREPPQGHDVGSGIAIILVVCREPPMEGRVDWVGGGRGDWDRDRSRSVS